MLGINPDNKKHLEQFSSIAQELMQQCPMFKHAGQPINTEATNPLPVDFAKEDSKQVINVHVS